MGLEPSAPRGGGHAPLAEDGQAARKGDGRVRARRVRVGRGGLRLYGRRGLAGLRVLRHPPPRQRHHAVLVHLHHLVRPPRPEHQRQGRRQHQGLAAAAGALDQILRRALGRIAGAARLQPGLRARSRRLPVEPLPGFRRVPRPTLRPRGHRSVSLHARNDGVGDGPRERSERGPRRHVRAAGRAAWRHVDPHQLQRPGHAREALQGARRGRGRSARASPRHRRVARVGGLRVFGPNDRPGRPHPERCRARVYS
mmetsp:Transcript_4142/g.12514  ORF Transcript_4142/g.12514 Transcript_4142/m.12514 type:complete len:254 (-) Transcript_4142:1537-2298(-)